MLRSQSQRSAILHHYGWSKVTCEKTTWCPPGRAQHAKAAQHDPVFAPKCWRDGSGRYWSFPTVWRRRCSGSFVLLEDKHRTLTSDHHTQCSAAQRNPGPCLLHSPSTFFFSLPARPRLPYSPDLPSIARHCLRTDQRRLPPPTDNCIMTAGTQARRTTHNSLERHRSCQPCQPPIYLNKI